MSYTIYHANGQAVVVPDNAIDTTFYNASAHGAGGPGIGTQLVGRNAINYGAPVAQNFLQMTENFASQLAYRPADAYALQGQLWFDASQPTTGKLYVRVSNATSGGDLNWNKLVAEDTSGNVTITGTATAVEFIGSGAGLTNIPASAIVGSGTWPVINPTGTPKAGDIKIVGSVISIYASGAWRQIFPAVYS